MGNAARAAVLASGFLITCCCSTGLAQSPAVIVDVPNAAIPTRVMVQSPAETATDLQVICLFRSSPVNTLHGSLLEINERLKGLLDHLRSATLFRGDPGETLLLTPPKDSLRARRLLIIGLGDSQTFSVDRMQLVGEILYSEASRLGVTHPFFAPAILDGGVTRFTTGQISEQVMKGFLRAAATAQAIEEANASGGAGVTALTYLAGPTHASDTREGIEKAIHEARGK